MKFKEKARRLNARAKLGLQQSKAHKVWSRFKTRMKRIFKSKSLTPLPPNSPHLPPASPHSPPASPHSPPASPSPHKYSWTNLKIFWSTLNTGFDITGLGSVKNVVKGLVECIPIYEHAAQLGREEYDELQVQLEHIFGELEQHFSDPPVIDTSMACICGSILKELDYLKTQQTCPISPLAEAGLNAEDLLGCYRRIHDHLQRLSRNTNVSDWTIVDELKIDRYEERSLLNLAHYNPGDALKLKRGPCASGTWTDLLARLHRWATGQDTRNIYWMSGIAGTGKTTIAYSLCEQLDTESNRMLCASFFCSMGAPVRRIIPSIAYQIAECSRPFRYALSRVMKEDPIAHTQIPPIQFQKLIVEPLSDVKVRDAFPTSMVVVIDGLDCCNYPGSTKLILDVLLTKLIGLPLKFIVSSLPEPEIRDQMEMEKYRTWVGARLIINELDSGEVKKAIETYLWAQLAPINPSDIEFKQLVARAGTSFNNAVAVVQYVERDESGHDPRARLDVALETPVPGEQGLTADDHYVALLRSAFEDPSLSQDEQSDMKLILYTVICAREPLTVAALSEILKINDVDRVQAALRSLRLVLRVMEPNMTVMALRASFPDYLVKSAYSGAWYCDAAVHHGLLARRCFEYIQGIKPQFNICRLESSYLIDDEVHDFDARVKEFIPAEVRYTCQYWSSHLDAGGSGTASGLLPLLSKFLTTHLLLWIEVRNLTKTVSTIPSELMTVKQWATRHDMPRDVIDLLSDAWRFVSKFVASRASQSTPHLYNSMLPLLPSGSLIRAHYYGRFRGLIKVEGTALNYRKNSLLAHWKFELTLKCMASSLDGVRIAIGGDTGGVARIYLLDALTGNLLLDLSQGDKVTVTSVAFSPDGTRLASGRSDGSILIWDGTHGQTVLGPFIAHQDTITSILYSRDSSYIFSASKDMAICKWSAASGIKLPLHISQWHDGEITCIATDAENRFLASGFVDGTIRVWCIQQRDFMSNPITIMAHNDSVSMIAFLPDRLSVVSGSSEGEIRVCTWSLRENSFENLQDRWSVRGNSFETLQDSGGQVVFVPISPDDGTIAFTPKVDGVYIRGAFSEDSLCRFSNCLNSRSEATDSSGDSRIILARVDGTIRVLDAQSTSEDFNPPLGPSEAIISVDISPNGTHIASGSLDGTVCVWDLAKRTPALGPLSGHTDMVRMVRFSNDNRRIISCSHDSTIRQWDSQSGDSVGDPIIVDSAGFFGVVSATYSPDGTLIVSLTYSGALSMWSSIHGQLWLGPVTAPGNPCGTHAEFASDGDSVLAGYRDGSIAAWDVQSGEMLLSYQGDGSPGMSSLAFSPDGLYLAQPSGRGKITQKDLQIGEEMPGDYEGHTHNVRSVRYSPDGTRLVSCSNDMTIHVWDTETGRSIFGPLEGHSSIVTSVAYSPDGKYVVSASSDKTIRVWDVQPNNPEGEGGDLTYTERLPNEDGWVVDGLSRRLFWVPIDLRGTLMSARNIAILSHYQGHKYTRIILEDALVGTEWANCWHGS